MMDGLPASAQIDPDAANSDIQADAPPHSTVQAHRRECRQRTRQIDDHQERRRMIQQCRQELQRNALETPALRIDDPNPAQDDSAMDNATLRNERPSDWLTQGEAWQDNHHDGYEGMASSAHPDGIEGGSDGSPPYSWNDEEHASSVAGGADPNDDQGGTLNRRNRRIRRLEQRLDRLESLLQQVLVNQQQLLDR
ncbi:MAG: hypothetical protein H6975_09440 [Gammaproteobacteria bacterium]|nr:hypothetical protein [Gammaproteobacteria bacterium]